MYCPSCGADSFRDDGTRRCYCAACGFTFFWNVAAAVAVAIRCGAEILLTVRGREPGRGMLDLPGGFVDAGESLEEAAVREIAEELRVAIHQPVYLFSVPNTYRYKDVNYHTEDVFFEVLLDEKPRVIPGDDVAGYTWKSPGDIDFENIALPSIRRGLERILT